MSLLQASNLSVTLGEKNILTDCRISAEKGEFIGIIGPNGAGKSTFLKTLCGLIPKTSGTVFLHGQNTDDLSDKEQAKQIAFMQQEFQTTFAYTAEEIVLSARYPYLSWWEREQSKDKELAHQYMAYTGVLHLKDKPIQTLSGGEKQRVILAKVLTQETPILFLDEPTASLDLPYQEEIFRLCQTLCHEGKTIFIVCHDLLMAADYCSRLVMLHDGHFVADGKAENVLTEKNLETVFSMNALVYHDPLTGKLSLFSYKKPDRRKKMVLVKGNNTAIMTIIRHLFLSGYDISFDKNESELTSLAARIFHGRELPEGSDPQIIINTGDNSVKALVPVYDVKTTPLDELLVKIDQGTL